MEVLIIARKSFGSTVSKEVLSEFKSYCSANYYPMNNIIELFMSEYSKGRFLKEIKEEESLVVERGEMQAFGTTLDEEIIKKFKLQCVGEGFSMTQVLDAFMRAYCNGSFKVELNYYSK